MSAAPRPDPRYNSRPDVRNTEAYIARQEWDAFQHGAWIKRVTLALLSLFIVGYIALSVLVPPRTWNKWKQQVFGSPSAQPAAQSPSPPAPPPAPPP